MDNDQSASPTKTDEFPEEWVKALNFTKEVCRELNIELGNADAFNFIIALIESEEHFTALAMKSRLVPLDGQFCPACNTWIDLDEPGSITCPACGAELEAVESDSDYEDTKK